MSNLILPRYKRVHTRDGLMTFDAQTIDSTGVFLVGELERLDQTLHGPLATVTWSRDIQLREDVSIADEVSSFTNSTFAAVGGTSTTGKAWIGKDSNSIASMALDIGKTPKPLSLWGMEISWTLPELASAMQLGRPVDSQKFTGLQLKHNMDTDEQVYIGDTELGETGMVNSSVVTNVSNAVTGNWGTATADQILADVNDLGFDQGAWKGPFDPDNGITTLDNEAYRTLLRAKIGANHWDGTLESSKAILDLVFNPDGHQPFFLVTANNEVFGVGDGIQTAFQLKYQGQNVYDYTSATLYRNDWQGNQQLYPTPRTNLVTFSEAIDNAAWGKTAATITANATTAPDGTVTADLVIPNNVNTSHQANFATTAITPGSPYMFSFMAKSGGYSQVRLRCGDSVALIVDVVVDLNTGLKIAGSGAVLVEPMPNGFWRISLPATINLGAANATLGVWVYSGGTATFVGDGVSGIYLWGGEIKPQSLPVTTSYIKTAGAAATVTDYAAGPFGQMAMAAAPLPSTVLSWSGQGTAYASGNYAFLIDNQDMTITIGVAGDTPSATQLALLTGGYITLKPQSVDISYYISPTISGPLFGFDASNQYIAGFDQGSWGKVYS